MWKSSSEGVGVGFGTIGEGEGRREGVVGGHSLSPLPSLMRRQPAALTPSLTVTPRLGSSFEGIGERGFTTLAKCRLPTPTGAAADRVEPETMRHMQSNMPHKVQHATSNSPSPMALLKSCPCLIEPHISKSKLPPTNLKVLRQARGCLCGH